MQPQTLDHVAVWVSDPDALAEQLLQRLPFRVLEREDDFVLMGLTPALGKLTLFSAEGPREQGVLAAVGIGLEPGSRPETIELDDGLCLELAPAASQAELGVNRLTLQVPDPAVSATGWTRLGFSREPEAAGSVSVRLGWSRLDLREGAGAPAERPLLNHVGLLVLSIEDAYRAVGELGLEVTRELEGEHSLSLFVEGPDRVEVEYVEHKPSFAMA